MYKPSDTRPMQLSAIRACLTGRERADAIIYALHEEHFTAPDVAAAYKAIKAMHSQGYDITADSVSLYMEAEGGFGPSIVDEACAMPEVDPRVSVRALTIMRGREEAFKLGEYLSSSKAATDGIDAIVAKANEFSLSYAKMTAEKATPLSQFMQEVDKPAERPRIIVPGLGEIDKHYRIRPGTFNVIAAPPAVGKTAIMLNMAVNAARSGHPSLTISLEVPEYDLNARITAIVAGVSAFRVKEGVLTDAEKAVVKGAAITKGHIVDNIHKIAPAKLQIDSLQSIINKWVDSHGIHVVYFDYLQRAQAGTKQEYERVTYVSETMAQVAKITNIPIVAVSSTRRRAASETGPMGMHDLRSSGQIEFDAHTVAILSRDPDNKNILNLDLSKNRDGGLWGASLYYDFSTQRITDNSTIQQ